jgi:hypothetical protein
MSTFLSIAGGIFIVLIILVFLVVFVFWRKWRRFKSALISAAGGIGVATPSRIHLTEDLDAAWLQGEEASRLLERLVRSGFEKGSAYTIEEMPPVRLAGLVHAKTGVCAVLYEHDQAGRWIDLAVQYEDGEELTVTNALHGEEMDHRPGATKIYRPGASLDELVGEYKKAALPKPKVRIDLANFRTFFEEAYARDMDWRAQKGGVSEDEIRRVAEKMGDGYGEAAIGQTFTVMKEREMDQYHEECLDEFRRTASFSGADWNRFDNEGSLVIVGESLNRAAFAEYLTEQFEMSANNTNKLKNWAPHAASNQAIFDVVNQTRSETTKAQKVGSVGKPAVVDIWFVPSVGG